MPEPFSVGLEETGRRGTLRRVLRRTCYLYLSIFIFAVRACWVQHIHIMVHEFDYLLIDISNSFTKVVPSTLESLGDKIISIPTNELNEKFFEKFSWNSDNFSSGVILSSVVPELNDLIRNVFGEERILEV